MIRFALILIALLPVLAQTPDLRTVRAYWQDEDAIQKVAEEIEPEHVDKSQGYLILEVNEDQAAWLESLGFFLDTDWERTTFRQNIYQSGQPLLGGNGIPGFECYFTVAETDMLLDAWQQEFSDLVDVLDIGDSWLKTQALGGHDLRVLRLTNRSLSYEKPQVFIITGLHARELAPVGLARRFAETLLSGYGSDATATHLLDEVVFHFLLQANPDGRVMAEGGSLWRKNTNETTCHIQSLEGTDLNRNFSFAWGCCGGSSSSGCSDTYRGVSPVSEPETLAVVDYANKIFQDLRQDDPSDAAPSDLGGLFFDIHSYGEWVLWPFGYDQTDAPNGVALQTLGRKFAGFNGYSPEKASQSFTTDGTTDDFAYGSLGVPAYTFELGTNFFQDCETFEQEVYPPNLEALRYAGLIARQPYLWPAGPSLSALGVQVVGDTVLLSGEASDHGFNQTNGQEPTQMVSGVFFYLNVPPWRGGIAGACLPQDGGFDQVQESFSATVDVSQLPPGQHKLYVQGVDSLGNRGAVYPVFFERASAPTGQINGMVREVITNAPLSAWVTAGASTVMADDTGAFTLTLKPDNYALGLSGRPYLEAEVGEVALSAGQQQNMDLQAVPFCQYYVEDGESGAPDWDLGDWYLDQEQAETGLIAFNDSPLGPSPNNASLMLTSPIVATGSLRMPVLRFFHQFDLGQEDQALVQINTDQNGWQTFATFAGRRPNFGMFEAALPEASTVQLRFLLNTASNPGDGWLVDRIQILGASYQCLADEGLATFASQWSDGSVDLRDLCKVVGHQWARTGENFGQ